MLQARLREEQRGLEARASAAVAGHFAHLSASMGVEDVRQMERAWPWKWRSNVGLGGEHGWKWMKETLKMIESLHIGGFLMLFRWLLIGFWMIYLLRFTDLELLG